MLGRGKTQWSASPAETQDLLEPRPLSDAGEAVDLVGEGIFDKRGDQLIAHLETLPGAQFSRKAKAGDFQDRTTAWRRFLAKIREDRAENMLVRRRQKPCGCTVFRIGKL